MSYFNCRCAVLLLLALHKTTNQRISTSREWARRELNEQTQLEYFPVAVYTVLGFLCAQDKRIRIS